MKLVELKTELKNRGMSYQGNKKDLIERLEENDIMIENNTNEKKMQVKKSSKKPKDENQDAEDAPEVKVNTTKKQVVVKKSIKKPKDDESDEMNTKKQTVKKSNKIPKDEDEDKKTVLQKKLDKLLEKEEKAAMKKREERDKSLLELSFRTMIGTWYNVHIKSSATLKELKDELAKKLNTDKFILYRITRGVQAQMGDMTYPDGTVHCMLSDDENEKQLSELGIINETFFSIHIKLR